MSTIAVQNTGKIATTSQIESWVGGNNGPYDFLKQCSSPGQLLPGEYVQPNDTNDPIWGQFLVKHQLPHSRNNKYRKPTRF